MRCTQIAGKLTLLMLSRPAIWASEFSIIKVGLYCLSVGMIKLVGLKLWFFSPIFLAEAKLDRLEESSTQTPKKSRCWSLTTLGWNCRRSCGPGIVRVAERGVNPSSRTGKGLSGQSKPFRMSGSASRFSRGLVRSSATCRRSVRTPSCTSATMMRQL